MIDMKNNPLLDRLIEHSKSIGESVKATFTAERFVVSVIDFVSDPDTFELDKTDKKTLSELLAKYLPFAELGFTDVKGHFMDYIGGVKTSYIDGIYIQQHIYKAKETAKAKGLDLLTPDILLECIFSDPSSFIKEMIASNSQSSFKEIDDSAAKILKDVCEQLDDLIAEEAEDEKPEKVGKGVEKTVEINKVAPKSAVAKLTQKVKSTHDVLLESIFGQDNAVSVFTTGYFQAELLSMTDKKRTRPRATFLFAGPPGVGKTFLAEKAAETLGLPFMRFDMSEYCDKEAAIEFIGSDDVYRNSKSGNFTGYVSQNPKSVLLFDEIEKAHISIIHLFLQILDAGRIRDSKTDREISLADSILIFTTNAGKQLYENSESSDFSGITRKVILNALQKDINPETGAPYFPAAICSRFASGNVVMFNHITAHDLRKIAKKEVLRHAANFENEIGIKIDIDEQVYTALLFAEGGAADARMIRSRAESFFDTELFELFRLLASEKVNSDVDDLDSISFKVELPSNNNELNSLFANNENHEILIFSSEQVAEQCKSKCDDVKFNDAQKIDSAKEILNNQNISFILIDLSYGQANNHKYLNIEDVDSAARDFFWFVREHYTDIPIYILQHSDKKLNAEERISFQRQGVRGVITLTKSEREFSSEIHNIAEMLHQQKSMSTLAKSNKLVSFETAQTIHKRGKKAEITLFDFELSTAVEAGDTQNIMSNVSKPDVKFDQIIGAENAKEELRFFIEYLKDPKKFVESGLRAPRGVLLYGPPGTGKTLLAKAVACEAGVTFISAEGNQFLKKYVGEGKDDLHELFNVARKYSPAILFIDEFEAIAQERRGGDQPWAKGEDVLTALLTEMDGFNTDITRPVFVLAATNFDVTPGSGKSLDQALLRRFDSKICVDLPNKEERIRFINMKRSSSKAFEISEGEIENIALRSTGMSLADLDSIMELSLRTAIRKTEKKVTDQVLDEAFEIFTGGEEKAWDASQLERTARHEAGHTFLCWQSGETPSYVTIVARGNHGGYMMHDGNEGKNIYTKDELLARIRTSLGGRAAEIVYYGDKDGVSTGASGDLASATELARQIICTYGMDEKFGLAVIGHSMERDGGLSSEVREAINMILDQEMTNAITLIEQNKHAIDALVESLMSNNHLTGSEIKEIFEMNLTQPIDR